MDFGAFADYEADLEQVLNGVAEKIEGEAASLRGGSSCFFRQIRRSTALLTPFLQQKNAEQSSDGSSASWKKQTRLCVVFSFVSSSSEPPSDLRLALQIAQMEVEVQTADRDKIELQGKLRGHKAVVARQKADLVRPFLSSSLSPRSQRISFLLQKALASGADRDDLLTSSSSRTGHVSIPMDDLDRSDSPSASSQSQAQRSRLLSATDKLSEGQQRLEDSHRIALETEELGTGILRDLRSQRDTLEHTRDTVRRLRFLFLLIVLTPLLL
jgi:hypothetical protein